MTEMQKCVKCNCLFKPSALNIERNKMSTEKAIGNESNHKDSAVKCKCSDNSANCEDSTLAFSPPCQSSVKIIVRTCNDNFCTKCNSSSHESTNAEGEEPHEEGKKPKEDTKNVCIRLCTKKKRAKKAVQTKSKSNIDDTNQTSQISIKSRGNEAKELTSDASLNQMLKSCEGPCRRGCGGCNRNTIIFPRCTPCGDGGANLESLIKHEFATFTRSLDEILSTLSRQRQDLRDVRDSVDMVLRYMREQFYISSSPTKTKLDWRENDAAADKKKGLERKSNTTSIKSEEKLTKKDASASKLTATPRSSSESVKKKKHFWDYSK